MVKSIPAYASAWLWQRMQNNIAHGDILITAMADDQKASPHLGLARCLSESGLYLPPLPTTARLCRTPSQESLHTAASEEEWEWMMAPSQTWLPPAACCAAADPAKDCQQDANENSVQAGGSEFYMPMGVCCNATDFHFPLQEAVCNSAMSAATAQGDNFWQDAGTGQYKTIPVPAHMLNPLTCDLQAKAQIILVERTTWRTYVGTRNMENVFGLPPGSLLENFKKDRTVMNLRDLALQASFHKKKLLKTMPQGAVFVGHTLRHYWHLDVSSGAVKQISLAVACNLVLGQKLAPCFHIAKWQREFPYCFLVPCRLLLPDTHVDVPGNCVTREAVNHNYFKFSATVSSFSVEKPPERDALFYVREPPCWEHELSSLTGRMLTSI